MSGGPKTAEASGCREGGAEAGALGGVAGRRRPSRSPYVPTVDILLISVVKPALIGPRRVSLGVEITASIGSNGWAGELIRRSKVSPLDPAVAFG